MPTKAKEVKCQECLKEFSLKSYISTRLKTVQTKEKMFKCQECSKEFGQKGDLRRNFKAVHTKGKVFKCQQRFKELGQNGICAMVKVSYSGYYITDRRYAYSRL